MGGTGATAKDQDRNTSWMTEIKENLKTAGILIEIGTDTSLRNALIVIDNSNEVFMKYFLRYVKGLSNVKEKINFHDLIEQYKHDWYLFSWDNVPGDDSERLMRFLRDEHDIEWAENAEICKFDDGNTIRIYKDEKSAEIIINDKNGKAALKMSDTEKTHDLKVKKEDGKLSIYHDFSNTALLDRFRMTHDMRNVLYHDPKKLAVSQKTLKEIIGDSLEMYNIALDAKIELKELCAGYDELKENIRKTDWNKRYEELGRLEDDIKSSFGLTPDDYAGDIFIACTPDTSTGLDIFQTLFFGALARDQSGEKAVRVLEFVDYNEENSWHDFYISRIGSHTWHGIVGCFWSKWGEGNRRDVKQIHELLKKYKNRVEYQEEARLFRYYRREALDQFFLK